MGLHSPCSLTTTLIALDAAGIAVVQHDEGWFVESPEQTIGPYTTPEQALEAGARWLNEHHWEQTNAGYAVLHADPQASQACDSESTLLDELKERK